jgi:hypothetical protein
VNIFTLAVITIQGMRSFKVEMFSDSNFAHKPTKLIK